MSKSSTKFEQYDLLLDSPSPSASGKMSQESSVQQTMRSAASSQALWGLVARCEFQTDGQTQVLPLDQNDGLPGAYSMPNISEFPNDASVCSLSDVLEQGPIPRRFYLSAKACAGILRRAVHRGKTLPPQLEAALKQVALHPPSPAAAPQGGGLGTDFDCDGGVITSHKVSHPLLGKENSSHREDAESYIAQPVAATLRSGPTTDAAHGSRSGDKDENLVAHSLHAEGFDASEDGTGRGTPLVPEVCGTLSDGAHNGGGSTDKTPTPDESFPPVSMCLNAGAMGRIDAESETLLPMRPGGFFDEQKPVAFAQNTRDEVREIGNNIAGALPAQPGMKQQTYVAYRTAGNCDPFEQGDKTGALTQQSDPNEHLLLTPKPVGIDGSDLGYALRADASHSGDKGDGGMNTTMVTQRMQVRRLTPTECCRLQGFSDSYLDITYRGKPATDSVKYKALGNSFAVPVVAWIGRRIAAVTKPT